MNTIDSPMRHSGIETQTHLPTIFNRLLIVVGLLCLLIGPNFGPIPNFLHQQMALEPGVIALLLSFLLGFSIVIITALYMDGRSVGELMPWLRSIGLGQSTKLVATIAGTIVGLMWGGLLLMSALQFYPDANVLAISPFRVLAASLAVIGTVMEDIIGRGYLMNRLNQINVPNWGQALLSALVFAFYHSIWAFNISGFIASLIYGLLLAGLFLLGKRSLTPVILGHALAVLIGEPFATMLLFRA